MYSALCLQILRVPGGVSEQEEVQVQVTRLLVESYFDVVRKNLQDAVPKAVMHFLVNSVQRGLQQHLIRSLYRYHSCLSTASGNLLPMHQAPLLNGSIAGRPVHKCKLGICQRL